MSAGKQRVRSKTGKRRIVQCKTAGQVMKMRLEGMTHQQIGDQLGVSAQRIFQIVSDELDRLNTIRNERVEQVQRLEIERLDEMLKAVYAKAKGGDLSCLDRVLAIMQRRSKLLGLDLSDKNAAPSANVVLQINEVVVDREALQHGQQAKQQLEGRPPERLESK
jgi:hypothetical protein